MVVDYIQCDRCKKIEKPIYIKTVIIKKMLGARVKEYWCVNCVETYNKMVKR